MDSRGGVGAKRKRVSRHLLVPPLWLPGEKLSRFRVELVDMKVMFEWKKEYSINIASIDAQHQNLFKTADELYRAMSTGQGKTVLADVLDRLIKYTVVHFAQEERLMEQYGYPDLAAHRVEHEKLTQQVRDFQSEFQDNKTLLSIELLDFIKTWLEKHIQASDMKYSSFLIQYKVA